MVDEIVYELKKTENSTSTLDLRWGLTAEVTDGRAKRIGKVIPYKRSQVCMPPALGILSACLALLAESPRAGAATDRFPLRPRRRVACVELISLLMDFSPALPNTTSTIRRCAMPPYIRAPLSPRR